MAECEWSRLKRVPFSYVQLVFAGSHSTTATCFFFFFILRAERVCLLLRMWMWMGGKMATSAAFSSHLAMLRSSGTFSSAIKPFLPSFILSSLSYIYSTYTRTPRYKSMRGNDSSPIMQLASSGINLITRSGTKLEIKL